MTEAAHKVVRGTGDVFHAWLDAKPNLRDNFDRGMEGISRGGQRLQDTDPRAYPWHTLTEGAILADVGSSGGLTLLFSAPSASTESWLDQAGTSPGILPSGLHPSISISPVVQNLPRVIEVALKANRDSPGNSFFDE